jgi:peptidoglycan/xylan/chitin deacetylase (PgdA/CDA1 family)
MRLSEDVRTDTGEMDRTTGARSRMLLSLLVVGTLLAVAAAPAGTVSIDARGSAAAARGPIATASFGPAFALDPSPSAKDIPIPAGTPGATPLPSSAPPVAGPACTSAPDGTRPARIASHGPRSRKVVALTFDDGYGPTNTLKILAFLRRYHVNATFFPVGRAVVLFPGVWREVVQAGYPIGDHTYDHQRLKGLCFADQLEELVRQQHVVEGRLGIDPMPIMRPPYGSYDLNTRLAARAAGDPDLVLWDVDTRDWSGLSPLSIARRALRGHQGSIILMHTFPGNTVAALPRIIVDYRARGYEFVTLGQLLGIDGPVPFP